MNTILKFACIAGLSGLLSLGASAQSSKAPSMDAPASESASAAFVKKRYNIKGTWSVAEQDGQSVIKFDDDFKTKGGPDLKLYLSSNTISDLDSGSVEGTSLKLGILKSNRGAQSYIIPKDVNLSDYKSVVIHCEAFSVLWGGFDLVENP
ncbi:MAG: DM13 domain-containing protein [Hellea sp.]